MKAHQIDIFFFVKINRVEAVVSWQTQVNACLRRRLDHVMYSIQAVIGSKVYLEVSRYVLHLLVRY